ncbi:aldose epimerase family protein [Stakelama pacifica]|nr:aldose epimerase family protein [Stakelama pacifica]
MIFSTVSMASAATAKRSTFGTLSDGTEIDAVTLTGANGVSATIISFGATLQAFRVPDRNGKLADIELGYDNLADYVAHPNYWGATVGRYANRIAGGKFTLDGKAYQLPLNDNGVNSLHGGPGGWDRLPWKVVSVTEGERGASVRMELVSAAGDQGYPGTVRATATYTLDDHGDLTIDYDAVTDAPTIINMTNHAIFNLAGEGDERNILQHRLTIPASRFTPVNANLIPTGELRDVAGSVFDFTKGRVIAEGIRDGQDQQIVYGRGYDHNFVLDAGTTAEPKLAARLEDPQSGRVLEVLTTEPGVQVYTGNFLDGTFLGKSKHVYRMGDGIALEPQRFPDTPNQPKFGSAELMPGKPYHHRMIFRVSTTD